MTIKKHYLLKTVPRGRTSPSLPGPLAKQSLGSVSPAAPLNQRKYSASTRSQSAAQLPRTKAATLAPRASQGVRFPRAPEATKSAKNNFPNKEIRLNAIRRLLKTGNIDTVRELARQFVKDYPDDPLPKDLEFLVTR